jgi:fatty acid desaturase
LDSGDRQGEEFRTDLRPLATSAAGSGNASARRILSAAELAPLTELSHLRSLAAVAQTVGVIALAIAFGVWVWPSPWVVVSIVVIGVQQHALFILAHEAAHYRLLRGRALNDAVGRAIGMAGAISMCTYRVIHRLHHNNLYTDEDPDTAIHGGYPRGNAYLWKKLAQDLVGCNAWKTFAYFFGAPALNDDTQRAAPAARRHLAAAAPLGADRSLVRGRVPAPRAARLLRLGGWRGLAQYAAFWLVPMLTVLQPILRLRAICEHGATTDFSSPLTAARVESSPRQAAQRARAGRSCSRITSTTTSSTTSIPAVPHYHLPRLHRLLRRRARSTAPRCAISARTFGLIFAPRAVRMAQHEPA